MDDTYLIFDDKLRFNRVGWLAPFDVPNDFTASREVPFEIKPQSITDELEDELRIYLCGKWPPEKLSYLMFIEGRNKKQQRDLLGFIASHFKDGG